VTCRHCREPVDRVFLDLGTAPPSNAYLTPERLNEPEVWYPLRILVCTCCWLVQTKDYTGREALFNVEYGYFSSTSSSWLAHAERYVDRMVARFGLGPESRAVEVASNDGYLLRFVQARGIPCYGIEPTRNTAAAARALGIEVVEEFFGRELAESLAIAGRTADLIVANNVLAHVPDIDDFVAGFARLLVPDGVATFEFPHLLRMVAGKQFDTAYHEHYSYLSLLTAKKVLEANRLGVFDVEELPTHGGSLRVYAQRADIGSRPASPAVARVLAEEEAAGVATTGFYDGFQEAALGIRDALLRFLLDARAEGLRVVGYGAAAKGNTLLNFAGVRPDLLPYVVDASPGKQGRYMPGSRIPIVGMPVLEADEPDVILVLPWNLLDELTVQLEPVRRRTGARLVVAVPELRLVAAHAPAGSS
jgi:SAM-dependent methyltransferase